MRGLTRLLTKSSLFSAPDLRVGAIAGGYSCKRSSSAAKPRFARAARLVRRDFGQRSALPWRSPPPARALAACGGRAVPLEFTRQRVAAAFMSRRAPRRRWWRRGGSLGCASGSSVAALRGLPTATSGRVVEAGAHAARTDAQRPRRRGPRTPARISTPLGMPHRA